MEDFQVREEHWVISDLIGKGKHIRTVPVPMWAKRGALYVLDAWEEAPFYSERERAALALTEAVTRITEGHVPDAVFEHARAHFNEQELIALVFTLTTINAWNRLAITMRTEVGKYQPKARPVSQTA